MRLISAVLISALVVFAGERARAQTDEKAPTIGQASTAPTPGLMAASDGEQIWYALPTSAAGAASETTDQGMRCLIMHHSPKFGPAVVRDAITLDSWPEAMIAADGRLFLIFRPRALGSEEHAERTVASIQAVYHEAARSWLYSRYTLESLPGGSTLIDAASDGRQVYVLMNQWSPMGAGGAAGVPYVTILRLDGTKWVETVVPESVNTRDGRPTASCLLTGRSIVLLVNAPGSGEGEVRSTAYELAADGTWTAAPCVLDANSVVTSCLVLGQTVVVTRDGEGAGAETWRLALLRGGRVMPIGEVDGGGGAVVVAHGADIGLVERRASDGAVEIRDVALDTGTTVRRQVFSLAPLIRGDEFGPLILTGGLLVALLVMFLLRPDPSKMRVSIPPGSVLTDVSLRGLALLIDLAPSCTLAKLITGAPLQHVVTPPLLSNEFSTSVPALLAIAICVIHSTIGELIGGRSFGKWMAECRVTEVGGGEARWWQVLARNAIKGVALTIPPMFFFVLMNPYRQSLGDFVARTIVVSEQGPAGGDGTDADADEGGGGSGGEGGRDTGSKS